MPMLKDIPSFERKKLCTMVTGRWEPHRLDVLKFFDTKPRGDLEFYGNPPPQFANHPMWSGKIPGSHSGPEKISVLENYRFCFCYENTTTYSGYISEKIFGCFAAGCVPIYWGAPNIEKYVPADCYIDPRKFSSYEELYRYIKSMSKEVYEQYIANIRAYLKSDKAQLFSPEHFNFILYQAATF